MGEQLLQNCKTRARSGVRRRCSDYGAPDPGVVLGDNHLYSLQYDFNGFVGLVDLTLPNVTAGELKNIADLDERALLVKALLRQSSEPRFGCGSLIAMVSASVARYERVDTVPADLDTDTHQDECSEAHYHAGACCAQLAKNFIGVSKAGGLESWRRYGPRADALRRPSPRQSPHRSRCRRRRAP